MKRLPMMGLVMAAAFCTVQANSQELTGTLKKVVDAATAALYQGGEGQKIYDKWFTQKIPPKSLNLNTPISAELKNEFAKPSDSPDPDAYK